MKKVIPIVILVLVVMAATGCRKGKDFIDPVRISYFDIRPQAIYDFETAMITVSVSNLKQETALVKTMADQGITNPVITYTTGNPVYIEYIPPELKAGHTATVVISVIITDLEGNEYDRADGRIFIDY